MLLSIPHKLFLLYMFIVKFRKIHISSNALLYKKQYFIYQAVIHSNFLHYRGVFRYVFLGLCALINVHNVNERKEICLSQRNQTNIAQMRPTHGKPPFLHHFRFPPRDLLIPVWRHAVKAAALSTDDVTHGSRSHMTGTGNNARQATYCESV